MLQEVHVLLPVKFEISSVRRPTFNYMLKTTKNYVFFAIFNTTLKRQRICNGCLDEKVLCIPLKTHFYAFKKIIWTIASMKKWSTRKSCVFSTAFHQYIICTIPVSSWGVMGKKQHVKNRVKSNKHDREVQLLRAVHFHSRWRQKSWSRHFRKRQEYHLCNFKSSVVES